MITIYRLVMVFRRVYTWKQCILLKETYPYFVKQEAGNELERNSNDKQWYLHVIRILPAVKRQHKTDEE